MYDVVVRMMGVSGHTECRRWRNRRSEAVDSSRASIKAKRCRSCLLKPTSPSSKVSNAMRCDAKDHPECREETAGTYMCESIIS